MIDTQTGLIGSPGGIPSAENQDTERAVNFRFAIAWSSLFTLLEPGKRMGALVPTAPRVPMDNRPRAAAPMPKDSGPAATPLEEPAPAPERPKAAPGSDVNWEMVIPKMVRPGNRAEPAKEAAPPPAAATSSASASSASTQTVTISSERSKRIPERTKPIQTERSKPGLKPTYVVTEYQIPAANTEFPAAISSPSSLAVNMFLALTAMVVLTAAVWIGMRPAASESVQVESAPGQRGWVRQHTPIEAGGREDRRLILYRPSLNSTESELEFSWNVAGNSIGWVFRARDASNYYAMGLRALGSGQPATLAEERFTVVDGKESPHFDKLLTFSPDDPVLHIKMSAVGSAFALYLQGQPEDRWTDATLATGGLGFLEEHSQPVEVQGVRLAYSRIPQSNIAAMMQSLKQSFK